MATVTTAHTSTNVEKPIEASKLTVTLNIEVGFDEYKRPVCFSAENGFQCRALRPKTYNAQGDLVHYCGLGERGQKPLRETSAKRGIVRPNKACPLHKTTVVTSKGEGKGNPDGVLMAPPKLLLPSSLYQLGRLSCWYLYVDASDFSIPEVRNLESDVSMISSTYLLNGSMDPEQLLITLCDIMHPHSTKWQSVTFQKVVLKKDGYVRECVRVLPNWKIPTYCAYEEPRQFYVYTHKSVGYDSFHTFRTEFMPDHLRMAREDSAQMLLNSKAAIAPLFQNPLHAGLVSGETNAKKVSARALAKHRQVNEEFVKKHLLTDHKA